MFVTDIIIISLSLLSSFLGLSRGFVKEFLSLSKWAISTFIAFISFGKTKLFLSEFLKDSATLDLIAGSSVFVLIFIILSIIFNFISKIINMKKFGFIDKPLGFVFGFIRIVLIFSLLSIIYNSLFFNLDKPKWMSDSLLIENIEVISKYLQNKFLDYEFNATMILEK